MSRLVSGQIQNQRACFGVMVVLSSLPFAATLYQFNSAIHHNPHGVFSCLVSVRDAEITRSGVAHIRPSS